MMDVFALVFFPPLRYASVGDAGSAREFRYCCVLLILELLWADVWVWVRRKRDGRYRSLKNAQQFVCVVGIRPQLLCFFNIIVGLGIDRYYNFWDEFVVVMWW
jgi:hypothetical protein